MQIIIIRFQQIAGWKHRGDMATLVPHAITVPNQG